MIKSDKGNIEFRGRGIEIKADLSSLFRTMREETSMNVDEIVQEALENSKYSEEELIERIEELLAKIKKKRISP